MIPVDILKTTMVDKLPTDLEGMEASMERLLALIDEVHKYVDNVVVSKVLQLLLSPTGFWFYIVTVFLFRRGVLHQITT